MAGCSRSPARHAKVPTVAVDHLTPEQIPLPRRSTPEATPSPAQQNPRRRDRGFESGLLQRRIFELSVLLWGSPVLACGQNRRTRSPAIA